MQLQALCNSFGFALRVMANPHITIMYNYVHNNKYQIKYSKCAKYSEARKQLK